MHYEALEGLDSRQRDAAACLENSVVAAGAGSGKTRVLAARYAWLVTEKHIPVDRIVTLTFTQKAVTEMYARIYAELCRAAPHSKAAETAVENFHTARIATLDSYCASIARNAARRFGLSPDFTVDVAAVREHIRQQALPFIIRHRGCAAIRLLLGCRSIEDLGEGLFVKTFTRYSTLSSPINFAAIGEQQKNILQKRWRQLAASLSLSVETARAEFETITEAAALKTVVYASLKTFFASCPQPLTLPDTAAQIPPFLTQIYAFTCVSYSGRTANSALALIKSIRDEAKAAYKLCASAANLILHQNIITELLELLAEFQESVNRQKRLSGRLTFTDVSQLALDALIQFPEIRQAEKEAISAIMIDEFQDNNEAQRNLLFLLAEQPQQNAAGIPSANSLCPDKLFFVGDEKQSIYKFRGADVAVFRKLKTDLGSRANLKNLAANYRSHPDLIALFNAFFSEIFLHGELPAYEAEYTRVESCPALEGESGGKPRAHFFLYNGTADETENEDEIADTEREAAFTAQKIRQLVEERYQVFKNEKGQASCRACRYGDFVILFRSYGRQHLFEKHLRQCAIPYTCENIAGFFNDAPVNDLYHLLRLVVYPLDAISYAAVLRSPFAALSREASLACLATLDKTHPPLPVFCEQAEAFLTAAEQKRYRACRQLYEDLTTAQNSRSSAELVSLLWYDAGYRFETLWNGTVQLYAELYDYFFELARQADEEGLPLIGFIDRIAQIKASGERIEDTDIPPARSQGVRLMSIHKSKGLEFPIVFICEAGSQGRILQNADLCYFDSEHGFSVNLPRHRLIPFEKDGNCGNYFFNIQKELEESKNAAELRRLLYVALTRAESAVFVTGKYKLDETKLEESASVAAAIRHLAASGGKKRSFLDLLAPVLAASETGAVKKFHTLEELPAVSGSSQENLPDKQQAFAAAAPLYQNAQTIEPKEPRLRYLTPSALLVPEPANTAGRPQTPLAETLCLDQIIEETGGAFTHADFGSIAHAYIEELFTGEKPRLNSRVSAILSERHYTLLCEAAAHMRNRFETSPLGQLAKNGRWAKSEFAFKSRVNSPDLPEGFAIVTGQMDLIFESEKGLYIVDFKTDLFEDHERHIIQLAAYRYAARDIFGKPANCLLYYLRSGNASDVTDKVEKVNIRDCVVAAAAAT